MRTIEDFDEGSDAFSRWLLPALIVSLLLHISLVVWSRGVIVDRRSEEFYEKIVPRTFHLERVEIDAAVLKPDPAQEKRAALAPEPVRIPEEAASFEKLMAEAQGTPAAPKIDQPLLSEAPSVASASLEEAVLAVRREGAESILEDSEAMKQAFEIKADADAGGKTADDLLDPHATAGRALVPAGALQGGETPGFSNLDELLAQTGPLSPETAPILMPTDLLFDYDKADLRMEALESLEKLGTIIQRNPQATFLIEGHTDSFGSDDYNLALSQRRAEMVKAWLVSFMQIPPERIAAQGLGKSRLIAPATGTIEEQQINRRVEIVIRSKQPDAP